ncbi:MAG: NAD-dependent epimerase/dehydratase family protein [Candidatus Omnitrophica bacterium]|nr:NAD-dependent epimerase/dehydratase family protein [Candidatus Omnitrophota bacterium]
MTKALVLGATGHIGAHIARALLAEGHEVRAAYRDERYLHVLEGLPVERVRVDLDRPQELRRALEGREWVFHAAGYYPFPPKPRREAIEQGVSSTRRILAEIGRARPVRIVYTSSAATIRSVPGKEADESDLESWPLTEWRSLYTTVKIAMEQEALRAVQEGLPITITHPSICIGEYDAHLLSGRLLTAFAKHRLPWITRACFNVVYTGDVGVGHARAAERGRAGEHYILCGENISLKEFASCVALETGVPAPKWNLPYSLAYAAGLGAEAMAWLTRREPLFTRQEVRRVAGGYRLDGSKARRELGLTPTPIKEAIRKALVWFRAHGML